MKEKRGSNILSILILIVIAGAAYYIVQSIRDTTQQAVAPFSQANSSLQTQVSDLMHPTPTIIPDPVTYINEVRALARLETIQYSVEKVETGEENQGRNQEMQADTNSSHTKHTITPDLQISTTIHQSPGQLSKRVAVWNQTQQSRSKAGFDQKRKQCVNSSRHLVVRRPHFTIRARGADFHFGAGKLVEKIGHAPGIHQFAIPIGAHSRLRVDEVCLPRILSI